jgi:hypothetical protein
MASYNLSRQRVPAVCGIVEERLDAREMCDRRRCYRSDRIGSL